MAFPLFAQKKDSVKPVLSANISCKSNNTWVATTTYVDVAKSEEEKKLEFWIRFYDKLSKMTDSAFTVHCRKYVLASKDDGAIPSKSINYIREWALLTYRVKERYIEQRDS